MGLTPRRVKTYPHRETRPAMSEHLIYVAAPPTPTENLTESQTHSFGECALSPCSKIDRCILNRVMVKLAGCHTFRRALA